MARWRGSGTARHATCGPGRSSSPGATASCASPKPATGRPRRCCSEALEIDPSYTAAMVLLGLCHWQDARANTATAPTRRWPAPRSRPNGRSRSRPSLAGAYLVRGGIAFMRDRHDEAVALCRRACELAPGDSWNHAFLALISVYADEPQAALDALATAFRLSPHPPVWFYFQEAQAHLWDGDLEGRPMPPDATAPWRLTIPTATPSLPRSTPSPAARLRPPR